MHLPRAALCAVTILFSLTGCGQVGPLYLPAPEPMPEPVKTSTEEPAKTVFDSKEHSTDTATN
ncbi:MAG: LPS translocon maturation chaperone LptM [Parahaliea sp.]